MDAFFVILIMLIYTIFIAIGYEIEIKKIITEKEKEFQEKIAQLQNEKNKTL